MTGKIGYYLIHRALVALMALALFAAMGIGDFGGSAMAQQGPSLQGTPPVSTPEQLPGARQGYDSDFWRAIRSGTRGTVSIPDEKAGVLVQSEGDNWRAIRNGPLSVYGSWVLLGMIILLALFFLIRGRIRIEGKSGGRKIIRFTAFERAGHWVVAVSFVILAFTGLNVLYGRYVLKPIIGPDLFSGLTIAGKYLHNYVAFAFILGLVWVFVTWVMENFPNRYDFIWLAKGGGMFSKHSHPPAKKFNAGQKILFWLVILSGISLSMSGLALLFPFQFAFFSETFHLVNYLGFDLPTDLSGIQEMQLNQIWHGAMGLIMMAVILAHIYIGTIGMEGAFDAMGTGEVDETWAKEHHALWVEDVKKREKGAGSASKAAAE